jgi:hypothetical protein
MGGSEQSWTVSLASSRCANRDMGKLLFMLFTLNHQTTNARYLSLCTSLHALVLGNAKDLGAHTAICVLLSPF